MTVLLGERWQIVPYAHGHRKGFGGLVRVGGSALVTRRFYFWRQLFDFLESIMNGFDWIAGIVNKLTVPS